MSVVVWTRRWCLSFRQWKITNGVLEAFGFDSDVYILSLTFCTTHPCKDEPTGLAMWVRLVQIGSNDFCSTGSNITGNLKLQLI